MFTTCLVGKGLSAFPNAKETSAQHTGKWHSAHIISLAPILAKVFEAIVLNWVDVVKTPQIDERQFGGLTGNGTTDALAGMVHMCCEATNKSDTFVRVLLVDYSQAFVHISHEILIAKLCGMGLPAHLVRWMAAFLIYRQQSIYIGHTV